MKRKPKTLKQMLLKAVVSSVVGTALMGGALYISSQQAINAVPVAPEQGVNGGAAQVKPAKGSPAWLIEKHDCWTGEAPKGAFPGHVVATKDGAVAPTYGGAALVDKALHQLFDGEDYGLTVHAFCR